MNGDDDGFGFGDSVEVKEDRYVVPTEPNPSSTSTGDGGDDFEFGDSVEVKEDQLADGDDLPEAGDIPEEADDDAQDNSPSGAFSLDGLGGSEDDVV